MRSALPLVIVLGGLTGCVSQNIVGYSPPASGPIATARLHTESGGANLGVVRYKGPLDGCACSIEAGETIAVLNNYAIGATQGADKGRNVPSVDIVVPADGGEYRILLLVVNHKVAAVSPLLKVTSNVCHAHESFVPEAGAKYDIEYNFDKKPCGFLVNRIESSGTLTPVLTKSYPPCLYRDDPTDWSIKAVKDFCQKNPSMYPAARSQ